MLKKGDKVNSLPMKLKKIKKSSQMHYDQFKDLQSTSYAEAMPKGVGKNYQIRPVYHEGQPMVLQN